MLIPERWPDAIACISGASQDTSILGNVKFYRWHRGVLIAADISGLPKSAGFLGFHIHEGTDCCNGFANTGGHYNPSEAPHPAHAGDLPPILVCNGWAYTVVYTDRFCLDDVIGRTVIIHSGPDDFHSQPAGNAGEKIACGVIRKFR